MDPPWGVRPVDAVAFLGVYFPWLSGSYDIEFCQGVRNAGRWQSLAKHWLGPALVTLHTTAQSMMCVYHAPHLAKLVRNVVRAPKTRFKQFAANKDAIVAQAGKPKGRRYWIYQATLRRTLIHSCCLDADSIRSRTRDFTGPVRRKECGATA